jgi:hypothetical protein
VDVPETISDDEWWRIQKGAAKVIPLIEGPWSDPKATKTARLWREARTQRGSN